MTRTEIFTRIQIAYADRGWAVPTSIEYASTARLLDTLAIADPSDDLVLGDD
jgi:hypothetical protein